MSMIKRNLILNLQLFAEGGGDTGSGDSGVSAGIPGQQNTTGVKNSLASVQYGVQEGTSDSDSQVETIDRNAEFEKLIKGEYKDLYDQRVQDIVQKRLKNSKETVERFNALAPTLDMLSRKYGVDASDIESLNRAIEEDDAYYEDEALEKGITVEQLKEIRRMERENADLKRQMDERRIQENADRIYAQWIDQADALKGIYPSFDLNTELQNPRFADLISNNVDVRTAYEVIHKDDIIQSAMQFTAQKVQQKVTNSIRANGSRPRENGSNGASASLVKSDVSQLTKADRQEIARRVARGERIVF